MLTFSVVLGYQGILFQEFLRSLFFSIRPTDPISGNAFDVKRKKKGDGLKLLTYYFENIQAHITTVIFSENVNPIKQR